jgi:hypothetical protein
VLKSSRHAPLVFYLFAACAAPKGDARLPERPPSSGEIAMGYQEAVDLGSTFVGEQYPEAELHSAEEVSPNLWRVRFGLTPKGSGRFLDLYFDGTKRTLMRKEEVEFKFQPEGETPKQ